MNRRFTSFRKTKTVRQSRVTLKTTVFFCYVHYCASRSHSHPQSPKLQPPALSYQLERNKGLGTRLFTWLLNRWSKVTTGALDYVIVLNLLPSTVQDSLSEVENPGDEGYGCYDFHYLSLPWLALLLRHKQTFLPNLYPAHSK